MSELLVGLIAGYYARTVLNYIKDTYESVQYAREARKAGVVRPQAQRVTTNTPEPTLTGGVRRPSPDEHRLAQLKDREQRARDMSV